MPRNWESTKEAGLPLSPRVSSKNHSSAESRRLRYPGRMTSKTRTRRSTSHGRRSRSPRRKTSLSPPHKRQILSPEKRAPPRRNASETRELSKRSRVSPRSRNKTPPPRRVSRERPRSYSAGRETHSDKPRSTQLSMSKREDDVRINDRYHGGSKYIVDRSVYRGSDKDLIHERDSLKKIVNLRDVASGNETLKRSMINPHDGVQRPVTGRGSRDYRDMDNGRMSRPHKYELSPPLWNDHRTATYSSSSYGRTDNHHHHHHHHHEHHPPPPPLPQPPPSSSSSSRYTSEGTRPGYDRDEILNHRRKYEESDRDRRRGIPSSSMQSDRRHCEPNSTDSFRTREPYYDDRAPRGREYETLRPPPREYESRSYDKPRIEDRSREDFRYAPPLPPLSSSRARSRSYDRLRDIPDRKDRYDERDGHARAFRRSVERTRPEERLLRRHPSPPGSAKRGHFDEYRIAHDGRRERSPERRDLEPMHYRNHEFPPDSERYSTSEYYPPKSQTYYDNEYRESSMISPRGRGKAISYRGRGAPTSRPFPKSTEMMGAPPPVRAARGSYVPREPSGRKIPFPPRKSFRGSFESRH